MATLSDLGLSEYEARVYRALLRTGPTTAKELSHASDVPMGRIYDILNGLEATDMIRSQNTGRPKKYAAVGPDTALDRLLEDRRQELEDEIRHYESVVDELSDQLDAGNPEERFWTVAVGPTETVDLLVERLAEASDRIVSVIAEPSPQFDLGEVGQRVADQLEAALDRNVEITVLISPSLLEAIPADVQQRYERTIASHPNFAVRLHDNLASTFHLIDRTEVCIEVPNPLAPKEAFALIALTDPVFASRVFDEFRPRWERGDALPD